MSDKTKIEWADATINAINGCDPISPGCTHCYAMAAGGRNLPGHPSTGLTKATKAGHVWTGEVRLTEKALLMPLSWKRPRRIFWNAHGDIFHENVPDEWIDRVFAVCALTGHHTHMILTKRAERMQEYWRSEQAPKRIAALLNDMKPSSLWNGNVNQAWFHLGKDGYLPNVWLGVSVEDQARKYRIDHLRNTPAAVRFISAEPLLESLGDLDLSGIDWVIVGGESGPKARPMNPDWARSIRDQCAAAGVAFHFKQWGEFVPYKVVPGGDLGREVRAEKVITVNPSGRTIYEQLELTGRGGEPGCLYMARVGKKRGGRMLDGVEHSEFPA